VLIMQVEVERAISALSVFNGKAPLHPEVMKPAIFGPSCQVPTDEKLYQPPLLGHNSMNVSCHQEKTRRKMAEKEQNENVDDETTLKDQQAQTGKNGKVQEISRKSEKAIADSESIGNKLEEGTRGTEKSICKGRKETAKGKEQS
jgi:hypothetical protein